MSSSAFYRIEDGQQFQEGLSNPHSNVVPPVNSQIIVVRSVFLMLVPLIDHIGVVRPILEI